MNAPHYPVMLPEVLTALQPKPTDTIVDGTLGAGGYSSAFLASNIEHLYSFDRDISAFTLWEKLHGPKPHNLTFCHSCFGSMVETLAKHNVSQVDGIVLDLGVSSMQLDEASRGFSFRQNGPLDMRMDPNCGRPAAHVVNEFDEDEIANILWEFGEERQSRRIAKAIVTQRQTKPFETTFELADLIRKIVHQKPGSKIDAATRSFQGLRIFVNDELGELDRVLSAAETLLSDGGRLVVVSFHSLEDRRVKLFLKTRSGKIDRGSRHNPFALFDEAQPTVFKALYKKVTKPSAQECTENPRSRSALMRAAVRIRH